MRLVCFASCKKRDSAFNFKSLTSLPSRAKLLVPFETFTMPILRGLWGKEGRGMVALRKRWSVWLTVVGLVTGTVSAVWWGWGQSEGEAQSSPVKPTQEVQGFADVVKVIRAITNSASEDKLTNQLRQPVTKERWLFILKELGLRTPARPEGWKFADYSFRRWRGVLASRGGSTLASRGGARNWRVLTMEATAYCPRSCCGSATGQTASGRKAEYGIVAVDPRHIPLGTVLYVDRYGFGIAADTGRAIKGYRIDLCYPTHREANRFGRQRVRVLVIR